MTTLTPLIEISIISLIVYYLLSFFWNTRSMDLMLGMIAFFFLFAASSFFDLPILHKIMLLVANVAVIAILIIFQPELRVALSKLSLKSARVRGISEFDKFLDELTELTYFRLAEKRIGALIVIENSNSLTDYADRAVKLDANFSPELVEAIFLHKSPLHDGALILRGRTILASCVILPLTDESRTVKRSLGTRHRAALGISQNSDAVAICVSEERGKVSIARLGEMTYAINEERFKKLIRSVFTSKEVKTKEQGDGSFWSKFTEWMKR